MKHTNPRPRRVVSWTLGVLVVLSAVVLGHNGEQFPPVQPSPPGLRKPVKPVDPGSLDVTLYQVYPVRWSWLHWWEANRDPYLKGLRQGVEQGRDQAAYESFRAEAGATLRRQLRSTSDVERAEASLALGLIGDTSAAEDLRTVARKDRSELSKTRAILALDLLGTEKQPAILARMDVRAALRKRGNGGDENEMLRQVVMRSDNMFDVSDALLALGDAGDDESMGLLLDVLAGGRRAGGSTVWREMLLMHEQKLLRLIELIRLEEESNRKKKLFKKLKAQYEKEAEEYPKKLEEFERQRAEFEKTYRKNAADYMKRRADYIRKFPKSAWRVPPIPLEPPKLKKPGPLEPDRGGIAGGAEAHLALRLGEEFIYMAQLRASAAIALSKYDRPEAVAGLVDLLHEPPDGYNDVPKGFALMSLGLIGSKDGIQTVADVLTMEVRGLALTADSPLRGYAAVALGLYARPHETDQGTEDRAGTEKIIELLAGRVADTKETEEVRCAAAVAMGLAWRTSNLKPLRQISEELQKRDAMLGGYVLLARGMLGDSNVLDPARQLLIEEADQADMSGILTRRGAVLGLGLCGDDAAIPVLTKAWHLNHFVNREVIVGLALHEAGGVGRTIIDRIKESEDADERAYLAGVLGELYASRRPTPLAELLNGSNYTFRNEWRIPVLRLANGFLYDYLLDMFGDDWI